LAVNVEKKPTAAFAMSILSAIFTFATTFAGISILMVAPTLLTGTNLLILASIAGLLTLVGSWLLFNNAAQRKIGSALVLVFSIVSMNFLGLIFGLIGGFLGYTYKTGASTTNTSSSSRGYTPP
jgi:uncharacterized membrane protein YesL